MMGQGQPSRDISLEVDTCEAVAKGESTAGRADVDGSRSLVGVWRRGRAGCVLRELIRKE